MEKVGTCRSSALEKTKNHSWKSRKVIYQFIRVIVQQKEIDLHMLLGETIRNKACLSLQRQWSKFMTILLANKKDKVAWKCHHEKLLNADFVQDKEAFPETGTVIGVIYLIKKARSEGQSVRWRIEKPQEYQD